MVTGTSGFISGNSAWFATRAGVAANLGKTQVYNRAGGATHRKRNSGSLPSAPQSGAQGISSLHRSTGMLSVAAQRALAHYLLELPLAGADECDGAEPPLGDLLADARDARQPPPRRVTCALLEGGVLASSRDLRVT